MAENTSENIKLLKKGKRKKTDKAKKTVRLLGHAKQLLLLLSEHSKLPYDPQELGVIIGREDLTFTSSEAITTCLSNLDNLKLCEITDEKDKPFYKITAKGKAIAKELQQQEELRIPDGEVKKAMSLKQLGDILGLTVKHDEVNKMITFLSTLTAYTKDSQFNISYRAPSSTGKSYIPIEISALFPDEDTILIAYCSPTAFFHDIGEWDDERKIITISLERKILVFLDQPHDELLRRLRPLLSHDKKRLLLKITDRRERHGIRTKNVEIVGFPSVIFCTGGLKVKDQEATRMIILSPETSQEKIREAVYLKAERVGNAPKFIEWLDSNPKRLLLMERIRAIKEEKIDDVIIPNLKKVTDEFIERCKILKPRHARDIGRFFGLIKGIALLNLWKRKKKGSNIVASEKDVNDAFGLWDKIAECQELGIPPYVYNLYKEVIVSAFEEQNKDLKAEDWRGLSRRDIMAKHYAVYGRMLEDWRLRQEILPSLGMAGLIMEEPDPDDKRRKLIFPISLSPKADRQKTLSQ